MLSKSRTIVSIDATGGLVTKININNNKSSHVFFYSVVINVNGKIIPLAQMISAIQNTNVVKYWLRFWSKQALFLPNEVITDDSMALLNAVSLAFNNAHYMQYLDDCLNFLLGNLKDLSYKCYVRLDRAHLVKSVTQWKVLKPKRGQIRNVKDFFVRSIAFCINIETLDVLQRTLESIIICSESKYKNALFNERYEWFIEKFKKFDHSLNDTVDKSLLQSETVEEKKFDHDDASANANDCFEDGDFHKRPISNRATTNFVQNIYNNVLEHTIKADQRTFAESKDTSDIKNDFRVEGLQENIIYLFSQFPSWTNVMLKFFDSNNTDASSAMSEELNKDMKLNFGFEKSTSANRFLLQHVSVLEPQMFATKSILKGQSKTSITIDSNIPYHANEGSIKINQNISTANTNDFLQWTHKPETLPPDNKTYLESVHENICMKETWTSEKTTQGLIANGMLLQKQNYYNKSFFLNIPVHLTA